MKKSNLEISENGNKWHLDLWGQLHNLKGPAFVTLKGEKEYYIDGKRYNTLFEWKKAVIRYKQGE